jgi:hypothetical protein
MMSDSGTREMPHINGIDDDITDDDAYCEINLLKDNDNTYGWGGRAHACIHAFQQ